MPKDRIKSAIKHLRIFELQPGATLQQVKEAYRILAKVWHPDRFASDTKLQNIAQEKFKEINLAYEWIISNANVLHDLSNDGIKFDEDTNYFKSDTGPIYSKGSQENPYSKSKKYSNLGKKPIINNYVLFFSATALIIIIIFISIHENSLNSKALTHLPKLENRTSSLAKFKSEDKIGSSTRSMDRDISDEIVERIYDGIMGRNQNTKDMISVQNSNKQLIKKTTFSLDNDPEFDAEFKP